MQDEELLPIQIQITRISTSVRRFIALGVGLLVVGWGSLALLSIQGPWKDRAVAAILGSLLMCTFAGILSWNVHIFRLQKLVDDYQHRIKPPGETDDESTKGSPHAIGTLLDILLQLDGLIDLEAIEPTVRCLKALLKQVRPEDNVLLTPGHRNKLHEVLVPSQQELQARSRVHRRHEALYALLVPETVAALGSLGQSDTLPILAQFAKTTTDEHLREIAQTSQDQLQTRLRSKPEQLPRPGAEPEGVEMLRLPHTPHADNRPEELLRAVEDEPDGDEPH